MGNFGLKQHYEMAKSTGTLDLSRRQLDKFTDDLLALAPFLRSLNLADNKFAVLSVEVQKLTLLKNLNLSGNRLTQLPEVIGTLVQLKRLNVSSNQISALPASLSKLKHLEQANLSDNRLTEFPLMFCGLKHLDVLELSRNRLTSVPSDVAGLHVIELNLNQNQIALISEKLADCPRLKTLRLNENCLQLGAIHRHIFENSSISLFELEGNLFEMKQLCDLDGYDKYMERYTAVRKKMF